MKNIPLFFLFFVVCSVPAWAQGVAVPAAPALPGIKSTAPQLQPEESIGVTMPKGAVTKAQADKYYADCVGDVLSLQSLNPYQRDYLCSCVATGLRAVLNTQDVKDLEQPGTPAGRAALGTMLKDVYFPCASAPLRETLQSDCLNRARANIDFAKQAAPRCKCFVTRVMSYAQNVGVAETEYRIAESQRFSEPYDALVGASGFTEERTKSYMACFNGLMP